MGNKFVKTTQLNIVKSYIDQQDEAKQDILVSGTNIKTINNESILGSGNISITGGVWGQITGTLSDQTDLNTALSEKAPLASPALTGTPTAPTASSSTNSTQIATTAFVKATSLVKTTYEYNKEISFGSTGKLCIGKFPCYDSNVTIEISSTTNTTYNGTIVLATQNISTSLGGSYALSVYGDYNNALTSTIRAQYLSGSNVISIYATLPSWSKNLVHIQCNALQGTPTDLVTSVDTIPSTATITATNIARNTFLTSHQDISGKENISNKVTSVSSSSTDTQYPSAKAMYTALSGKASSSTVSTLQTSVSTIEGKIPSQASSSNQLADKEFVNSSIATSTATFRGTVTATDDTEAAAQTALATITTKDNNDYAFVLVVGAGEGGNDKYKRYKYSGSAWSFEYIINTTGFTAAQWAAINSGIVAADKTKIDALQYATDAEVQEILTTTHVTMSSSSGSATIPSSSVAVGDSIYLTAQE